MTELEKLLLDIGGERVVLLPEPNLNSILNDGRLFDFPIKKVKGEHNRCHMNSSKFFFSGEKVVTGYALSGGIWRQHSWGFKDDVILETTVKAEKYYGVILQGKELLAFIMGNFFTDGVSEEILNNIPNSDINKVIDLLKECC